MMGLPKVLKFDDTLLAVSVQSIFCRRWTDVKFLKKLDNFQSLIMFQFSLYFYLCHAIVMSG